MCPHSIPLLGKSLLFDFSGKLLLDVALTHIFPMVMSMTLYLIDVTYSALLGKMNNNHIIWVLITVIAFMGCFVASILVNDNCIGWCSFCAAWVSLTVLKLATTEDVEPKPHIISED